MLTWYMVELFVPLAHGGEFTHFASVRFTFDNAICPNCWRYVSRVFLHAVCHWVVKPEIGDVIFRRTMTGKRLSRRIMAEFNNSWKGRYSKPVRCLKDLLLRQCLVYEGIWQDRCVAAVILNLGTGWGEWLAVRFGYFIAEEVALRWMRRPLGPRDDLNALEKRKIKISYRCQDRKTVPWFSVP
jgi:hypothetical protein